MCEWVETAGWVTSLGPHAGTRSSNREGLFSVRTFITTVTVMKNKILILAQVKIKLSNNTSLIFCVEYNKLYVVFLPQESSFRKDSNL